MSRLRDLFVVSRTAANELRERDPIQIGNDAGVGFVLSGAVRKIGSRVRLNISLYNGENGEVVWSERFQDEFDNILDLLDEIVVRVASTVFGRIEQAELDAAKLKRPGTMTAYEYYLRGMELHRPGGVTTDQYRKAITWFDRAISEDESFSRGYSMKVCSWANLPDFDFGTAENLIEKAIRLNPQDAEAHRIMGTMQMLIHRDYEKARAHYEQAMKLAPNNAFIVGRVAAFHTFNGEPEIGLELLDRAEAMDPILPVWVVEDRISALYILGRFDELFEQARLLPFQTRRSRIYRAVVHSQRGEIDRARQLIAAAMADDPNLTSNHQVGGSNPPGVASKEMWNRHRLDCQSEVLVLPTIWLRCLAECRCCSPTRKALS